MVSDEAWRGPGSLDTSPLRFALQARGKKAPLITDNVHAESCEVSNQGWSQRYPVFAANLAPDGSPAGPPRISYYRSLAGENGTAGWGRLGLTSPMATF